MVTCERCQAEIPPESRFCLHCGRRVPRASGAQGTAAQRLQRQLGSDFEVRNEIGKGGFGVVFAVYDKPLDRMLAVKVIRPELVSSDVVVARFRQEAKIVAQLKHENVLSITFAGDGEGVVYCAMPLIVGDTLKERIKREGRLPVDKALRVFGEVASGLEHAHAKDIVHRDVKPANIMLDRDAGDRAVLVDFGIAKSLSRALGKLSVSGQVVGSPEYMAPERRLGAKVLDARCDIYSMGVVAFQMLTGRLPFGVDSGSQPTPASPPAVLPDVRRARPEVPAAFAEAILKCLAMEAKGRWPSARAAAEAAGCDITMTD